MEITVITKTVPSVDKKHTLKGVVYVPQGEPKGFFHVVHGMAEHIRRYDRFMRHMAENGYICFGYDHLGHGRTAESADEWGYIAADGGWELLLQDVGNFADAVKQDYGEKGETLPYILMGHSMGSFIVRLATEKYVKPDKLIIMGTGGNNPAAGIGLNVIAAVQKKHGPRHVSPMVDKLCFGSFNKRFGGGTAEDPSPWLTADRKERQKYYDDAMCGFPFTVSAMRDLVQLMKQANRKEWFTSLPQGMPVLLVSGAEDPVGNYAKGVRQVYTRLQQAGVPVRIHLYPGGRHEILNDVTYEQVVEDIEKFIE